ncbi:hypothetical protein ISN44_As03g032820 [Arabidopsis suecica]|uniref:Uncharacterized protein n=1 Tax=Arabidopsis suecica TaxID=45249 RepID=A0A8T2FNZ4_ARASU|nr:hypothetical protein ISN44_As03g032820 [Arabidopsis suecica]
MSLRGIETTVVNVYGGINAATKCSSLRNKTIVNMIGHVTHLNVLHRSAGSDISTAEKVLHPSVKTSSIPAVHEKQKERGNMSLALLPVVDLSPIPIGGAHLTRGPDDIFVNKYFLTKAELM